MAVLTRLQTKKLIPLLQVLRTLKPEQRVILLGHLDDVTRDGLYKTIAKVLNTKKLTPAQRRALHQHLAPYRGQLRVLVRARQRRRGSVDTPARRRCLAQVGAGGGLPILLKYGIPLLLSVLPLDE